MSLITPFPGPTSHVRESKPKPRRTSADFDDKTSRRRPGPRRFEFTSFDGAFHTRRPARVFLPGDQQPDDPEFWDTHCRTPAVVDDEAA